MKKILAFILAAVMLLSLCACNPGTGSNDNTGAAGDTTAAGANTDGQLLVGFGKAQIDPTESVPLQGYGSTQERMSNGMVSHMYQIAIAITTPDGTTGIIIASDICTADYQTTLKIREGIEKELGVPKDNVIISAIHQHSACDMGNAQVPSSVRYRDEIFIPGGIEAAKLAMENRAVTTAVQTATVETENMNFVRHYKMEDGSYAGPNFGDNTLTAVEHAGEVDNHMQLVKFVREGQTTMDGKEARDILLTNYQGHPLMGTSGKDLNVHSDLIGVYRDEVEESKNCEVIYISGASGNMMFTSQIKDEKHGNDYKTHGKKLAKLATSKNVEYTDIELTAVKASKMTYTGDCNHDEDHLLEKAEQVWAEYEQTRDSTIFRKNGFESRYHCTLIISHAKLPATKSMDIFAMSFGDLAFVGAPYEMFSEHGMSIKEESPFDMTIVCYIANGSNGYLPTEAAWDFYCYERHNSNFTRGTGSKVAAEFVKMLNGLHEQY